MQPESESLRRVDFRRGHARARAPAPGMNDAVVTPCLHARVGGAGGLAACGLVLIGVGGADGSYSLPVDPTWSSTGLDLPWTATSPAVGG